MAQKIATSLLYILLGFLAAALIDHGVEVSLERLFVRLVQTLKLGSR